MLPSMETTITISKKSSGSDTRNSSTSSSSSISSSSSNSSSNSVGLSTNSSSSGISSVASMVASGTSSSSAGSLIGSNVNFSVGSHLGSVSPIVRHNNIIPPPAVEISPLLKVKAEPGLAQPLVRPELKVKAELGTVQHVRPDSEEEVDDHFAKALGNDTWKMIQEKKMNL